MNVAMRPPVLVTIGDPNGIGPEIAVKAAIALCNDPGLRPVVIGDRHIVDPLAAQAGFGVETNRANWGRVGKTIDVFDTDQMPKTAFAPGKISADAGHATVQYLVAALDLQDQGAGRAIVGCPHSETAVNQSGRVFSGYPNLLAELRGTGPDSVFLMLIGGGLRIVHATLHEGINTALKRLTPALIESAGVAADQALRDLGFKTPRIGVFGINPHAGEGGLFGDEDITISALAVQRLQSRGIDAVGPEGADTLLVRDGYDAFIAMYHDQGHIPVKLLAGRNISAMSIGGGLRFSSVGHGAAFDIAGQNAADPAGVIGAIRLVGGAL